MQSTKQKWMQILLWPNVAVALTAFVLALTNQISNVGGLPRFLAYSLVYANFVGIFGAVLIGGLLKALSIRRLPLLPVFALCVFVAVPIGCLIVQTVLMGIGAVSPRYFWRDYLFMQRLTIPGALVFGLGAMTHTSLRERLQDAEQKLHEKEIAEERALKLAAEARLRSLEARIQPHFLFNTLNSISALIAVNPGRAEQMIGRLAALLRASLDIGSQSLIPLRQELIVVESFLDIERSRFGDKLRGSVEIPEELRDAKVPSMSVQTLVENAVKHGIGPAPAGGNVRVSATDDHGSLRIEVSDSGPGFELAVVPSGHGLENLVERLDALFGDKARLNAFRRDGRCVVEMVLPCK